MLDLRNSPLIVGILNITPNSFSDGGQYNTVDLAIQRVKKMIDEGVDIIDIGSESTHPNNLSITEEEELKRLLPIIDAIKQNFPNILLSVDTYKAKVADLALKKGVDIINDIWGLSHPKQDMLSTAIEYQVPTIITHNQTEKTPHLDVIDVLIDFFETTINKALSKGLRESNIIIDPGFGFGKTMIQNIEILKRLGEVKKKLPYPMMIGISRKKTLDMLTGDEKQPINRDNDSVTIALHCLKHKVELLRVHNVKAHKDALTIWKELN